MGIFQVQCNFVTVLHQDREIFDQINVVKFWSSTCVNISQKKNANDLPVSQSSDIFYFT